MLEVRGERSAIELLSVKISLWLKKNNNLSEIEYLKTKLGIETILINISKGIVVYGAAIILHVLIPTLILHSAYFAVRRVSFGLHAQSSIICTLTSVFLFVIIPYFVKDIMINNYIVIFLFMVIISCLFYFAPADTEKHPLLGKDRRVKLRNQSMIVSGVLMIVALVIPNSTMQTLITVGVILQIINILPVTYKLLRRSYDNYEKFENEING